MPSSLARARSLSARLLAAGLTLGLVLGGVLLSPQPASAAIPVTGPVVEDVPQTASSVATSVGNPCNLGNLPGAGACGSPTTVSYGNGNAQRLVSFTAGTDTYQVLPLDEGESYAELFRVNNAAVTGERDSIFLARATVETPFNQVLNSSPGPLTMAQVFTSDVITEGSDNTFANQGTVNINNVERISFLRRTPLTSSQPDRIGLTLLERGGNDTVKVAAVLSVDGAGNPTSWGPLVTIAASAWGTVVDNVPSTVFRRDVGEANYRPTDRTGAQRLAGMYISFAELGVTAGTPTFGVSLLPSDATAANVTAATAITTSTDGGGNGIDLIGGVFVSAIPPLAVDDSSTGPQGAPQTLDIVATPGDSLFPIDPTLTELVAPEGGTVSADGTVVTVDGVGTYTLDRVLDTVVFQPEPAFVGAAPVVTYRVFDTQGASDEATLSPTVTPVAVPDTSTGPQGEQQVVDVTTNDAAPGVTLDPSTLTLLDADGAPATSVTVPDQGTYSIDSGNVVFTPLPTFTGTAVPVRYQVDDDDGNTVESTYTPTVTPVTPTADADTSTGVQGVPQSVDPLLNDDPGDPDVPLDPDSVTLLDEEGDPVDSVTVAEGVYTVVDGRLVFTPEPTFTGTAPPVSYRVADANGTTAVSTYTPTVTPVNPVADPDTSTGPQGEPQSVDPLVNDVPGDADVPLDPATLTLVDDGGNPVDSVTVDGGVYTSVDGRLVFTPDRDFTGTAPPASYRIADVNGTTATSTYTPTVIPVPTADPDTSTGVQGVPQSVDPLLNDVPGDPDVPLDPSSLTLLDDDGDPVDSVTVDGGVYTAVDGRLVFTPESSFSGTAPPVSYRIADVDGTTATSTYTPTVTAVEPSAEPDTSTGVQGVPPSVDPLLNDAPGDPDVPLDPASLTLLDEDGNPTDSVTVDGGVYTSVDGRLVFTPERTFSGTAPPASYRIADLNGTTATSTYTPTVTPVTPTAAPDTSTGVQGAPQSVDPLSNDAAGDDAVPLDPSSLTLLDGDGDPVDSVTVDGGVYTSVDGRLVFTPERTFTGTAPPASYRIADLNGTTATSTYTPTVIGTPPVAVGVVSETGNPGQPVTVDPSDGVPGLVPGTVVLVSPDGSTVTTLRVPGEGVWTVDPSTGLVTFTPERGFRGQPTDVQFVAVTEDGAAVSGTLRVRYSAPAGNGGLAATGGTAGALLAWGGLLLLGGATLLGVRSRGAVRIGRAR